jgi:hypothetical protein
MAAGSTWRGGDLARADAGFADAGRGRAARLLALSRRASRTQHPTASAGRRCAPSHSRAGGPGASGRRSRAPSPRSSNAGQPQRRHKASAGRAPPADARRPCRSSRPVPPPSSPCAHRPPPPARPQRRARRAPRARRSSSRGGPSPHWPAQGRGERARPGQQVSDPPRRPRRSEQVRTTAPAIRPIDSDILHFGLLPAGLVTGECLRDLGSRSQSRPAQRRCCSSSSRRRRRGLRSRSRMRASRN